MHDDDLQPLAIGPALAGEAPAAPLPPLLPQLLSPPVEIDCEAAASHPSDPLGAAPDPLTPRQWLVVQQRLNLSPRELDVMRGITQRMSDVEIVKALRIARSTLRTHLSHIFRKCGTRKRVGIAMKAVEPFIHWWQ